jgi:ectoine hydroxylase-related dioxygenase (phytanoyl-CoA dioxygenase family)
MLRKHFISIDVQPGDLLLFNAQVPHYGVANSGHERRVLIFFEFASTSLPLIQVNTETQFFPLGDDHRL